MGEIAEDVVDGTTCSDCGQYFDDGQGGIHTHGYPVVCQDCYADYSKIERKQMKQNGLQIALKPTL